MPRAVVFRVEVVTSNAAFGDNRPRELARMLHEVALDLENGYSGGSLRDLNGNTCGRWSESNEQEPEWYP